MASKPLPGTEVEFVGGPFDGQRDCPEVFYDALVTPPLQNGDSYYYVLEQRGGRYYYRLETLD